MHKKKKHKRKQSVDKPDGKSYRTSVLSKLIREELNSSRAALRCAKCKKNLDKTKIMWIDKKKGAIGWCCAAKPKGLSKFMYWMYG